jgi:hypothetical protein
MMSATAAVQLNQPVVEARLAMVNGSVEEQPLQPFGITPAKSGHIGEHLGGIVQQFDVTFVTRCATRPRPTSEATVCQRPPDPPVKD